MGWPGGAAAAAARSGQPGAVEVVEVGEGVEEVGYPASAAGLPLMMMLGCRLHLLALPTAGRLQALHTPPELSLTTLSVYKQPLPQTRCCSLVQGARCKVCRACLIVQRADFS